MTSFHGLLLVIGNPFAWELSSHQNIGLVLSSIWLNSNGFGLLQVRRTGPLRVRSG